MRIRNGKMNMKSRAGMTLVEVLIAMALFAVVAVPLFAMFSNSMKMERRAMVESIATYTAQMKMEEVYGLTATELFDLDGIENKEEINLSSDPDDLLELKYVFFMEPESGGLGLIEVEIIVWNEYFEVDAMLNNTVKPAPPTVTP